MSSFRIVCTICKYPHQPNVKPFVSLPDSLKKYITKKKPAIRPDDSICQKCAHLYKERMKHRMEREKEDISDNLSSLPFTDAPGNVSAMPTAQGGPPKKKKMGPKSRVQKMPADSSTEDLLNAVCIGYYI